MSFPCRRGPSGEGFGIEFRGRPVEVRIPHWAPTSPASGGRRQISKANHLGTVNQSKKPAQEHPRPEGMLNWAIYGERHSTVLQTVG